MLIDTNVVIRHLTGEPLEHAESATRTLRAGGGPLVMLDVVTAECAYVLQRVYRVEREHVARMLEQVVAISAVEVDNEALVLRALELFAARSISFADAYVAARAEQLDTPVLSFDRDFDRIPSVERVEPR